MRIVVGRLAAAVCVVYVLYLCVGVVLGSRPVEAVIPVAVVAGLFVVMTWATKRARTRSRG